MPKPSVGAACKRPSQAPAERNRISNRIEAPFSSMGRWWLSARARPYIKRLPPPAPAGFSGETVLPDPIWKPFLDPTPNTPWWLWASFRQRPTDPAGDRMPKEVRMRIFCLARLGFALPFFLGASVYANDTLYFRTKVLPIIKPSCFCHFSGDPD